MARRTNTAQFTTQQQEMAVEIAKALEVASGGGYEYIATHAAQVAPEGAESGSVEWAERFHSLFHKACPSGSEWREDGRQTRFKQAVVIGDEWPTFKKSITSALTTQRKELSKDALGDKKPAEILKSSHISEAAMKEVYAVAKDIKEGKAEPEDFGKALKEKPLARAKQKVMDLNNAAGQKANADLGLRGKALYGALHKLMTEQNGKVYQFDDETYEMLASCAKLALGLMVDDKILKDNKLASNQQIPASQDKDDVNTITVSMAKKALEDVTITLAEQDEPEPEPEPKPKRTHTKKSAKPAPELDDDTAEDILASLDALSMRVKKHMQR